ncbi:hypothetical protein [Cognatishimia maritima]|uniref:Uncharacterized protein n=1 Tax=Cognatishimia maritima TaxID=870908 RepID=A0A1M5RST9_9RHOB|nr:hypothetical protein [Cognatishimia maritima]SHH29354.1 hypothetical protein SAMN04488044_2288 [Cognatishimia maritima]
MIEVATTRRVACAYSRAHEERAMAFRRLFKVFSVFPRVPLSRIALTVPSR